MSMLEIASCVILLFLVETIASFATLSAHLKPMFF